MKNISLPVVAITLAPFVFSPSVLSKSIDLDDLAETGVTIAFSNDFDSTSKNSQGTERLGFEVKWKAADDVTGTAGKNYVAYFTERANTTGVGDWLAVSWNTAKKGDTVTLKGIFQSDLEAGFALTGLPKDVDPIVENGQAQDISKVWITSGSGASYKATSISLPDGLTISAASDVTEQQSPEDLIIDIDQFINPPSTAPDAGSTVVLLAVGFSGLSILNISKRSIKKPA